jgi:hypothetical protein
VSHSNRGIHQVLSSQPDFQFNCILSIPQILPGALVIYPQGEPNRRHPSINISYIVACVFISAGTCLTSRVIFTWLPAVTKQRMFLLSIVTQQQLCTPHHYHYCYYYYYYYHHHHPGVASESVQYPLSSFRFIVLSSPSCSGSSHRAVSFQFKLYVPSRYLRSIHRFYVPRPSWLFLF